MAEYSMWLRVELPDGMEEDPIVCLTSVVLHALADADIPVIGTRVDLCQTVERAGSSEVDRD